MIRLFTPWYKDDSNQRQIELNWCLRRNCSDSNIREVFIFPESKSNDYPRGMSEKLHVIQLNRRITYQDIVNFINDMVDSDRYYNIIANTDIYFDETITNVRSIDMKNVCIVLTRYESNPTNRGSKSEMIMNPEQSNDVWIFKGFINKEIECNFHLGLLGCEGIFGNSLKNAGYNVYNFSKDILCYHFHVTQKRNYTEDTRLRGVSYNVPLTLMRDYINQC